MTPKKPKTHFMKKATDTTVRERHAMRTQLSDNEIYMQAQTSDFDCEQAWQDLHKFV